MEYGTQLTQDFFIRPSLKVSPDLLGCIIVSSKESKIVAAKITETEAYPSSDPTSHAYERKPTIRTAIQYKNGGYLYEYLIMGLYTITSIVTSKKGEADVSFIRSVEPIEGIEIMRERRKYFGKDLKRIASGPGLLSQALGLTPKDNCMYICDKNSEIKIFKPSD
ncbi:MAG: DNA-3-methyladenine glycosylase, partial [bacterium]